MFWYIFTGLFIVGCVIVLGTYYLLRILAKGLKETQEDGFENPF